MAERQVAVLPGILVPGTLGPRTYRLLLTDRRFLFVLEQGAPADLIGGIGGALGAFVLPSVPREVDREIPLEELAEDPRNPSVPYRAVERLHLRRLGTTYALRLTHRTARGKRRTMKAHVAAPASFVEERVREGVSRPDAFRAFADRVRAVLEEALPPSLAQRVEWEG